MHQQVPNQIISDFDRLPDSALIRIRLLVSGNLIPFSPNTVWRKVREGKFPLPIKVSSQVTAWRVGDIRTWLKDPLGYNVPAHNAKRTSIRKAASTGGAL